MTWHAIDTLDEAYGAMKSLLFLFDFRQWIGLDIVAGFVLTIGATVVLLVVAIPVLLIGLAVYGGVGLVSPTIAAVIAGLFALVTLGAVAVITVLLVGVPVHTYLRYYALFVLARCSPQYDMLDEVQAVIEPPD